MPGIDIINSTCGAKGSKVRLHLRVERGHSCIESIGDLIQMKRSRKAMVLSLTRPRRASRNSLM